MGRTRLAHDRSSIGVLTNPAYKDGAIRRGDEEIGLTDRQILTARQQFSEGAYDRIRDALLAQRDLDRGGLLVIYPISRHSRPKAGSNKRLDLFDEPDRSRSLVASFGASLPLSSMSMTERDRTLCRKLLRGPH